LKIDLNMNKQTYAGTVPSDSFVFDGKNDQANQFYS